VGKLYNKRKVISIVARKLKNLYKDNAHHNLKVPLDELIFIILSVRTTEKVYIKVYRELKKRYPRWDMLLKVPPGKLAALIKAGGKYNVKAGYIKGIIEQVINRFGKPTLDPLKSWSDAKCEEYLVSLPGVGKKVARCVMLYALGRKVFPVDSHCWRVSRRLGWIESRRNVPTTLDMDTLQKVIPVELRYSAHVNLLSLGRDICTPKDVRCSLCCIEKNCIKKQVLFE